MRRCLGSIRQRLPPAINTIRTHAPQSGDFGLGSDGIQWRHLDHLMTRVPAIRLTAIHLILSLHSASIDPQPLPHWPLDGFQLRRPELWLQRTTWCLYFVLRSAMSGSVKCGCVRQF